MVAEIVAADRPATPLLPPAIRDARLPASYTEARAALERCECLDEVAEWADRVAALASYARQAHDPELERMAKRIRARAVRRAGELLQTIPTARGRRTDLHTDSVVGARTRAATAAGMSTSQSKNAIRVAKIPAAAFETLVEASDPPGVARLAGRAELRPPAPNADPDGGFERARGLLSALLVCYRSAPPAVRARIRDMVARAFVAIDSGDDHLSPAQASGSQ